MYFRLHKEEARMISVQFIADKQQICSFKYLKFDLTSHITGNEIGQTLGVHEQRQFDTQQFEC